MGISDHIESVLMDLPHPMTLYRERIALVVIVHGVRPLLCLPGVGNQQLCARIDQRFAIPINPQTEPVATRGK